MKADSRCRPALMDLRPLCLVFLLMGTGTAAGQSLDEQILERIYAIEHAPATRVLTVLDGTSYAAFVAIPTGTLVVDILSGSGVRRTGEIVLSQSTGTAVTALTKRIVRRPRPYLTQPNMTARSGTLDAAVRARDSYSFPSGHATLSFAAATSLSLQAPKWYVVVPAYGWATGVAVSRIWHGVHYPSDVLAGALVGAVAAIAVHYAWPRPDQEAAPPPIVAFMIRF